MSTAGRKITRTVALPRGAAEALLAGRKLPASSLLKPKPPVMKSTNPQYKTPEHGLQMDETIAAGDADGANHLYRYWWAWHVGRKLVSLHTPYGNRSGFRVLDLGCGCGYGCRIMAEIPRVERVTGLDVSRQAVDEALRDYGSNPRLRFAQFYLENHWNFDAGGSVDQYDLVTCFETLELLRHREFFLEQVATVLASDGVFLVSADFLGRDQCNATPKDAVFHYARWVLDRTLHRYFKTVVFSPVGTAGQPQYDDDRFKLKRHYDDLVLRHAHAQGTPEYRVGENAVYCADPIHP